VPGIDTTQIIEQYISTIRVLKKLDPSGILLEMVSDVINKYLRSRSDTLRRIVERIIHDEDEDLKNELGEKYVRIPINKEQQQKQQINVFKHPNAPN
jgi:hypothetical protein